MKRLIEEDLLAWKNAHGRKPLIVRGARQVGKTYSIEKFGRDHFEGLAKLNLERDRHWHRVFDGTLAAQSTVAELEVLLNQPITPGKTLLFFDEIQACPRAVLALRYLCEELPALHVIAAGSLLEAAAAGLPFPVGRVQFLEMHPLCFAEYLWAAGKDRAAEVVLGKPGPVPASIHELILDELRRYCFLGGMPQAVRAFVETRSTQGALAVHRDLCETYRQDFAKYAPRVDPRCLDSVFTGVARNVGQQVKYSRLAESHAHTTIKRAFDLLCNARVIRRIAAASPSGLPLGDTESGKRFKALMLDIGLWQHLSGLRVDIEYTRGDLLDIYRGAMAEQFVGQEMAIAQSPDLYYWSREARGSSAEVDYLAVVQGGIFGVEVKSGPAGKLRSLHLMLQSYPNCAGGLVFSSAPYAELPGQKLTFLPLYFAYSSTLRRSRV